MTKKGLLFSISIVAVWSILGRGDRFSGAYAQDSGGGGGSGTPTMTIEQISKEVVTRKLDAVNGAKDQMSSIAGDLRATASATGDISAQIAQASSGIETGRSQAESSFKATEQFAKDELKKIVQADPSRSQEVSNAEGDMVSALNQAHVEIGALSSFYTASARQLGPVTTRSALKKPCDCEIVSSAGVLQKVGDIYKLDITTRIKRSGNCGSCSLLYLVEWETAAGAPSGTNGSVQAPIQPVFPPGETNKAFPQVNLTVPNPPAGAGSLRVMPVYTCTTVGGPVAVVVKPCVGFTRFAITP